MEKETEKVTARRIYTSRLSERLVRCDDDALRWKPIPPPEPTGIAEIDTLAAELAKSPIPPKKDLERAGGIPPLLFRKLIQARTGMRFSEFISHYRMLVAEELLRCTDVGYDEIVRLTGYSKLSLQRIFKATYGLPPLLYRQRHRPEGYKFFYRYRK